MKLKSQASTSTVHRAELDRESVIEHIGGIPSDAAVYVEIPEGANWNGMRLEIGTDAMLCITWTVNS